MSYNECLYRYLVKPLMPDDLTVIQSDNIPDPERLRLGQSGGIHDFFAIFYAVMKLDSPEIIACAAYPDMVIDNKDFTRSADTPIPPIPPMITWKVVKRTHATISGKPHTGRRQLKPRVLEEIAQNERYSYISTLGVDFDNTIQFDCWERTNYQAEILSDYLEKNMVIYSPIFQEFGVKEVVFDQRITDSVLRDFRIPVISMQYYVKTQTIYKKDVNKIEEIRIKLCVNNE